TIAAMSPINSVRRPALAKLPPIPGAIAPIMAATSSGPVTTPINIPVHGRLADATSNHGSSAKPEAHTVSGARPRSIGQAGDASKPAGATGSAKIARKSVLWRTTAGSRVAAASSGVHNNTLARERITTATTMMPTVSGTNMDGATAV